MAVVAIEAPGLQDPVHVAVFAWTADVIHHLAATVFENGLADAAPDIFQDLIPGDAGPFTTTPFADAFERIQDAVRVFDLVRRDHTLRARPAAAARMVRVALDLPDIKRVLVHVRNHPAP